MKKITKAIASTILAVTIFAFPVLACGDMTNGSKCLVQTPPTETNVPKTDSKTAFDLDKEIASFLRIFLGKIFG